MFYGTHKQEEGRLSLSHVKSMGIMHMGSWQMNQMMHLIWDVPFEFSKQFKNQVMDGFNLLL